jgi:hypothetical protein
MKHLSLIYLVGLAIAGLAPSFASAAPEPGAQTPTPAGATEPVSAPKTHKKMKMKKPIKMHEPMTTPMAKPGMMKEDMNRGMAQKDSEMKDMVEKEEKDMR